MSKDMGVAASPPGCDLVEIATKLLSAHPNDLGRAMMADRRDSYYRQHNLYPSPAIEAGKPVYLVVQYAIDAWGVQKCRSASRNPTTGQLELYYEWLWPATQDCRSRGEALEWMRADAEGRSTDFSKFERRFDRYVSEEFDQHGRPFLAAQGTEAGTAETEGLGPKDDGPVGEADASNPLPNPNNQMAGGRVK